jgi:acetyltransferase-like isoleucine patch superfamily enzyme
MVSSTPEWHHLPANPWNAHAWIVGEPEVGDGCWIGAFTVLDGSGGLVLGAGCDISAGAQIYTHSTVRRALSGRELPIERRRTVLGDHVHVGAGAVVLMGCTIGSHSVVAAGAVVTEGTTAPGWSVLAGVPARVRPGAARRLVEGASASETGPEPHQDVTLAGTEPGEQNRQDDER